MKGIIPIGGRGTRMRPVTYSVNKHFIPVANRLLVEYPIKTMVEAGIEDIGITYNPRQLQLAKKVLGDGSEWGAEFTYILQPEPLGLAHIVQVAEDFVNGESFVFHLGDNIFTEGITKLVDKFKKEDWDGLVAMVEHEENTRMGVPYFDDKGRLERYVEKPKDPPHKFAIPGVYLASSKIFGAFSGRGKIKPSARGEYEIADLFQWMIDQGYKVGVEEYDGLWLDPGKFGDWLESNQILLDRYAVRQIEGEVDSKSRIKGRVEVGKESRIINSRIRGPVRIGEDVVVKDSFIGPYTSIYHHSRIEECRIANSVVMEGAELEKVSQPVDTSIIGRNARVVSNGESGMVGLFLGSGGEVKL